MDMLRIIAAGVYLYGALSLTGIFALAISLGDRWTCILAIASAGAAYFTQTIQAFVAQLRLSLGTKTPGLDMLAAGLMVTSICFGLWAFVRLAFPL